jgi:RNA polymerase sigma-70 factor (ECF subfamily)
VTGSRPPATRTRRLDPESRGWIERLAPGAPGRDAAIGDLHALLLRASRFEIGRRRAAIAHLREGDHDDLAQQSADDALVAVLSKLGDFRGDSRFTTWAYKFALLEAAVTVRRRAWQGREVPLEPERWALIAAGGATPQQDTERAELMAAVHDAIAGELTPHQRRILVAVAGDDGRPSASAWRDHHAGNHTYEDMRRGLDARFDPTTFEWVPYLHRYLGGVATEELERSLIDAGAINALGFRFVGMPRARSAFQPV